MSTPKNQESPQHVLSRRQAIAAIALAVGSLVAGRSAMGQTEPAKKDAPGSGDNLKRTSLHQEVDFSAAPERIYAVLLDSKAFTAFTGRTAQIDPREGGAFSLFSGLIVGRTIELVPDQRVVQAWRPAHWEPGTYSVARFELKQKGTGATLVFDHTGFPEGDYDSLLSGWNGHYWSPLAKFLA